MLVVGDTAGRSNGQRLALLQECAPLRGGGGESGVDTWGVQAMVHALLSEQVVEAAAGQRCCGGRTYLVGEVVLQDGERVTVDQA